MHVTDTVIDASVAVCKHTDLVVTADLAQSIRLLLPRIDAQVCVSRGNSFFGEEIVGTETPHLLEHMAIELLVLEARLDAVSERVYTGHTSWISQGHRTKGQPLRMRVCVTYDNDLVTMAALKKAAELLCWAAAGETCKQSRELGAGGQDVLQIPDIERITQELHALRTF